MYAEQNRILFRLAHYLHCLNSLPNDKILDLSKFKAFAGDSFNYKPEIYLSMG